MAAKVTRRYESFRKSLDALNEAKVRDMTDSFVLSGTSAKFCITFDLCRKLMKDILMHHYAITDFVAVSPKEVLLKGFQAKLKMCGWRCSQCGTALRMTMTMSSSSNTAIKSLQSISICSTTLRRL